ncbi:MAG: hypothetical protein HY207_03255 [Nitrospirae bacterium]|nr:hypothetical protein [Nitrospirota bacterium]
MSTESRLSDRHDALRLTEVEALERRIADQETRLLETRDELDRVREEMDQLRATVQALVAKSSTTCKKCGTAFDLFSHHYSIGLFDNIVYVKCPQCQTPMPVDPHLGVRKD